MSTRNIERIGNNNGTPNNVININNVSFEVQFWPPEPVFKFNYGSFLVNRIYVQFIIIVHNVNFELTKINLIQNILNQKFFSGREPSKFVRWFETMLWSFNDSWDSYQLQFKFNPIPNRTMAFWA